MINTIITSVALLATSAVAQGVGRAIVVNGCSFPVGLTNVPSSGGGASQVGPQQLQPGGSYSQTYTQLTNGNGWSMKLTTGSSGGLLQYEYTFQGDGVIWYDLSAVNGDPFNGDWGMSASGGCDPKQTAYRYPTDDTYGMQSSCPQSSDVTVTLCSSGGAGAAPPADPSTPAPSDPAPAAPVAPAPVAPAPSDPAPVAPVPSVAPVVDPGRPDRGRPGPPGNGQFANELATQDRPDGTVTNVVTTVVTHFVTISPSPVAQQKRSEHLHRHAQHRRHI